MVFFWLTKWQSPEVVEALELQDRLIAAMNDAIEKIDITMFDQFDLEDDQ